ISRGSGWKLLFVGDDWAEDHHDVCLQDAQGRVLAARRLPEGVAGITRLHELVAGHLDGDDPSQVVVAIETDRGPWVRALVAAGYRVYAVNPKQAARHREVVAVSGKKDGTFDAATLADMGRTRRHQLREVAADSDEAEAVNEAARAHQNLAWERTRHARQIRAALREQHLGKPEIVTEAYAAGVRASAAVIAVLNEQVKVMEARVES